MTRNNYDTALRLFLWHGIILATPGVPRQAMTWHGTRPPCATVSEATVAFAGIAVVLAAAAPVAATWAAV